MRYNRVPVATYRVQLSSSFTFEQARAILPYLKELGVSELYASPILRARPGSTHGYDVVDSDQLNPELGPPEGLDLLQQELQRHGLGLLLDIVPNHMAASFDNRWWNSLLEYGRQSPYANYFDVEWEPVTAFGTLHNRVLLPLLGKPYGEVLESQELQLSFEEGAFSVSYYDHKLPIAPQTYGQILSDVLLRSSQDDEWPARLRAVLSAVDWPSLAPAEAVEAGDRLKRELRALWEEEPEFRNSLQQTVRRFGGEPGITASFDAFDALLEAQWYRLSYWRMASESINYRRFFDVTDLVGVRVEDPEVFEARQAKIFELVKSGVVTGVRIDHIDGLFDPVGHLRRLQERLVAVTPGAGRFYLVVEKILAAEEVLPETFVADGTTGYDFLNLANGVFVDFDGLVRLSTVYAEATGERSRYEDIVYRSKHQVIETLFAGEMRSLSTMLSRLAVADRNARDFAANEILGALTEVTAALGVYRTYSRDLNVSPTDRRYLAEALGRARQRSEGRFDIRVFDFLERVLLLDERAAPEVRREWLRFVMRWQQFTGRAMAKGVEDTAFYVYNRLISMNEVGGEPAGESLEDPVERFHRVCARTAERWPLTLNASSTHDTKRSEDIRARLNVLSELPSVYERHLRKWRRANFPFRGRAGDRVAPDANEEYFIYQTLLGVWPLDPAEEAALPERLDAVIEKSAREAKVHTSWIEPDVEYEGALKRFVREISSPANVEFREDFLSFQSSVAFYGFLNSLGQTVLKLTAPGVPDLYQGSELWDFSLVDPDNRRSVDYAARERTLKSLRTDDRGALVAELLETWRDGRIKLFVIAELLALRNQLSELFSSSSYRPLVASGTAEHHLCAFSREDGTRRVIVAVPRLLASMVEPGQLPLGDVWGDHQIEVPSGSNRWRNVFTGDILETSAVGAGETALSLRDVFARFPVAVLTDEV